jgi:hypothetical protein
MPNDNVEVDSPTVTKRGNKTVVYDAKTEYPKRDKDFIHQYIRDEEGCKCKKIRFKWLY